MSGAFLQGGWYSVALGPPGTLDLPRRRHAEPSAEHQAWLERARPALDAYFATLAGDPALPLARFGDRPVEEIAGAVSDDLRAIPGKSSDDSRRFRQDHQGGPVLVRLRGSDLLPSHESLELCLLVTRRVPRGRVEPILRHVAVLLDEARQGAAAADPAPAPPRSLLDRLRGWLRRQKT
jgi:hypothetical protein